MSPDNDVKIVLAILRITAVCLAESSCFLGEWQIPTCVNYIF